MQIGILGGTGAQGRGLAARLGSIGVTTLVGSRDVTRAAAAVDELRARGNDWPLRPATNDEIAEQSDVVFLTVPFAGVDELLDGLAPRFRQGAALVDVTVPLRFSAGRAAVLDLPEGSATQHIRARVPAAIRVASALKTIPAAALDRVDVDLDCDDFVCGDSREAREEVIGLVGRIPGLRPLDCGGLDAAGTVERMTALAIGINKRYKVRTARFRAVGV